MRRRIKRLTSKVCGFVLIKSRLLSAEFSVLGKVSEGMSGMRESDETIDPFDLDFSK